MIEPDSTGVSLKLLVLKTRQVEKLLAFYQTLGIAFAQEQHGKGPVHHSGVIGGAVLELYPLANEVSTADQTTRLGFVVANVDQIVESLQASGTPVTSPPTKTAWGYRAVLQDPDGRAVELYQS